MRSLIEANVHFLGQAETLLRGLNDEVYAQPDEGNDRASIGRHLRHCFDHYISFLRGIPEGMIDYDQRGRSAEIECLTDCALGMLQEIREGLADLGREVGRKGVKVRMDCGEEQSEWQESTVGRELQFLAGHTVHHFAMISGIARQRGLGLKEEFGVAPSTLKYREMANID